MRLSSKGCLLALVLRGFADPMRRLAANCIGLYDRRMRPGQSALRGWQNGHVP